MAQKIKGRTFHLPFSLQETLNKLCKNINSINKKWNYFRDILDKFRNYLEDMVDKRKYIML